MDQEPILLDKQKRIDFIMFQWHKYFAPTRHWTEEEREKLKVITKVLIEKLHEVEPVEFDSLVQSTIESQLSPLIHSVIERIIQDLGPEFENKVIEDGKEMTEAEFQEKCRSIIHKNIIDMVFMKADRRIVATKLEGGGYAFAWESDKAVNSKTEEK